eukprot:927621-Pyramimonas_sp.AAC.1
MSCRATRDDYLRTLAFIGLARLEKVRLNQSCCGTEVPPVDFVTLRSWIQRLRFGSANLSFVPYSLFAPELSLEDAQAGSDRLEGVSYVYCYIPSSLFAPELSLEDAQAGSDRLEGVPDVACHDEDVVGKGGGGKGLAPRHALRALHVQVRHAQHAATLPRDLQ